MSSSAGRGRGRGCGREGNKPLGPLRKPGEFTTTSKNQSLEDSTLSPKDEKPPVSTVQQSAKDDSSVSLEPLADVKEIKEQDHQTEIQKSHLWKSVNTPAFVPKSQQVQARPSNSLVTAVNAPEFIPGRRFPIHKETAEERSNTIVNFMTSKMKQLTEDPGLFDEIAEATVSYLLSHLKDENDMTLVSDILFEKCVADRLFQYTGSRLAAHMDRYLVVNAIVSIPFRNYFLKRCSKENTMFDNTIESDPERACNLALFMGELLRNYKDKNDKTIGKLLCVVTDLLKKLLSCSNPKLLITAGKLLKLTGGLLDQENELFHSVKQLAVDELVDSTARVLFHRVCELKETNWGLAEAPVSVPDMFATQETSIFIPNIRGMLEEEQESDIPVLNEDEWNDYAIDSGAQEDAYAYDENAYENDEELFYQQMYLEQYGVPYPTTESWSNADEDDYYEDYEKFLQG